MCRRCAVDIALDALFTAQWHITHARTSEDYALEGRDDLHWHALAISDAETELDTLLSYDAATSQPDPCRYRAGDGGGSATDDRGDPGPDAPRARSARRTRARVRDRRGNQATRTMDPAHDAAEQSRPERAPTTTGLIP